MAARTLAAPGAVTSQPCGAPGETPCPNDTPATRPATGTSTGIASTVQPREPSRRTSSSHPAANPSSPETPEELVMAWRAPLLCSTASVRTESRSNPPEGIFPQKMTEGVYRLGYNAKSSYGAHSFLIRRPGGIATVDAPRWTKHVVAALDEQGGLPTLCSRTRMTWRTPIATRSVLAREFRSTRRIAAPLLMPTTFSKDAIPFGSMMIYPRAGSYQGERRLSLG